MTIKLFHLRKHQLALKKKYRGENPIRSCPKLPTRNVCKILFLYTISQLEIGMIICEIKLPAILENMLKIKKRAFPLNIG